MDADNMYGEINIKEVAAQVAQEFINSGMVVKNVDYRRAGIFIAASVSRAEIHRAGLARVVPTRLHLLEWGDQHHPPGGWREKFQAQSIPSGVGLPVKQTYPVLRRPD